MSLLDCLPDKCTICERTRVRESGGTGTALSVWVDISTDVECWEQQASSSEMRDWQKRGINVDRKVFFVADPELHEGMAIKITNKNGTAVAEANQTIMDVSTFPSPDASAGFGILYKAMVNSNSGSTYNAGDVS